ncbi:DUF4214 domain-containing protein [Undibacterium flavidum]|uniref:DUF4214 domain-containing protein n=1 Tax=Undibacterium flavidum TaxID=2762297 RepID=A0ABR6Y8Z4_9BURK|nr:DUF4214 domain-containing protein [Undibacterium flavidum]MBC3873053.1 DUF4214 domain-containing protein [Undibacterium flavidum]
MAVTTQMRTQVAQLYVSLFGRAPEAEGLSYWAKQLEAGKSFQTIAQDMFNVAPARDYYPSTLTNQEIVAKFYQNVLGRPADAQGLAYWTARLNTESTTGTAATKAIAVGTVITEMLTAVANYNGSDADALKSQSLLANKVTVALYYGIDKANDAKVQAALVDKMATVSKDVIAMVTPGANGADAPKAYLDQAHTFTLTESYAPGSAGSAGTKVVYWGYNPIAAGNNGTGAPSTGGIPVEDLKAFLLTITGLDLKELGLIDADGKDPFQNVTNLTLSNPLTSGANTSGSGSSSQSSGNTLTISFADGTSLNAEVKLGEAYFKFLSDLLFDKNGNTRLFEKVIGATSGTEATLQPIKLTPAVNNGGTLEEGYTTLGDDVIVAGRLELLHQAYIDGGAGFNVLEIDAKGTYAQPTQLLNIQEIRVTDLPNFYTTPYGSGSGNLENTHTNDAGFPVPSGTQTTNDSWIDLSRATALGNSVTTASGTVVKGKLIVTDQSVDSGNLTIVGVRNGATLRLEGNFGGGSTTIQYGVGQTGTLNMELAVGDVTAPINVLQNASTLNIDSQGVENHFHTFFAGGSVSNMTIKGTGVFGVDQDLFSSFNSGRPAVINASANTGGLDVTLNNHYNVKITGTAADDEITTNYSTASGIVKSVIVAGNGDNTINANNTGSALTNISITSGTGNDVINATEGTNVVISAGDGNNTIVADSTKANANISVTTGAGSDNIQVLTTQASGTAVVIDAGNGMNKVVVSGADVSVTTGTGNDTVTINGTNNTFLNGDNNGNDNNSTDFQGTISSSGVLLKVDLGAGVNTLNLGRLSAGVVALEGSSITGSNITLFVENNSDLREATLSGITKVTLKQELTITDDQFKALGANNFSTWHASFGATEDLRIVVDSNVILTDLLNGKDLSANVRLNFELHNGATLTLTAEQLHKYVAVGGISGADGLNGKVVINQAGANFDPFNSGNNYLVIDGGSISVGNLYGAEDVTIIRDGTYERPTTGPLQDSTTLGSATATADLTVGNFVNEAQVLKLIGAQNIKFTGVVDLGGEVSLGGKDDITNNETDAFSVDFSAVTGKVTGLTLDHFQDVGTIRGNGQAGNRIDVILNGDVGTTGFNKGLNTSGVETFMVTRIDTKSGNANGENGSVDGQFGDAAGSVTINLCDLTKDVKFIGLKGNTGNTLTLNSVPWGAVAPHIVLEGDGYANANQALKVDGSPDTSDVGNIVANFYGSNATAVVDINNAGVELGTTTTGTERKFSVGSITLNNASTATINVAQGDATISAVAGSGLSTLTFVGSEDVAVTSALPSNLATIDASAVVGAFSATLVDPVDHKVSFVGGAGVANLTLNNVSISSTLGADFGSSIVGGTGGVNLKVVGTNDLSAATLTNVKSVGLTNGSTLTLSAAEITAIGQANVTVAKVLAADTATLNVNGLDSATVFNAAGFSSGVTINTVTVAAGTTALNAATSLKGVAVLSIPAGTTLSMTAAQFLQLPNSAAVVAGAGRVNITDVTQADVTNGLLARLGNVSSLAGSITFKESVTLATSDSFSAFKTLNLGDSLTLTVPSVAQLGGVTSTGAITVNGGTNSTIVFTDSVFNTGSLNAVGSDVINASRFNVTTIKMLDTLVAGQNIDQILTGLKSTVTKVVYNAAGATLIDQVVNLDAGVTTATGTIMLNPTATSAELNSVTLNLNGGVNLDGGIDLRTGAKDVVDNAMARLKTLTINSTGTATNVHSGDATNIINGTITGAGTGGVTENNLLNVVVNADQALKITGGIVFSSHNDGLATTTFDSKATASLTINGSKSVSLGNLDTSDADVVALKVNNAGTGVVTANIGSGVQAADALSFTGGNIKLNLTATRDMTADVLTGVTDITVSNTQTLSLTMAQATALGASHLAVSGAGANLNLVGLSNQPFAVANYSAKFTIALTLANDPVVTLNSATSLAGINSLVVPDGTTLNLTAAQFMQLVAHDIHGSGLSTMGTVNITDLTQADIDAIGAFDLSGIVGVKFGTITLKESVALQPGDSLGGFKVVNMGDGMTLSLPTITQADGLTVNGGANSALIFTQTSQASWSTHIDASGFHVSTLKIAADAIGGRNIDSVFTSLPGSVAKQITSDMLNAPTQIDQIVSVDAGSTVPGRLIFNPAADTEELHSLTLNLKGGVNVGGDIVLDAHNKATGLKLKLFDTLTINSTGTAGNTNSFDPANIISGKITAFSAFGGNIDNNLLKVNINADQALNINGIEFSSVNDGAAYTTYDSTAVAVVNVTGTKNVSLGEVNTNDTDVDGLTINNTGSGTVSVTLNSAKVQDADVLTFSGSKIAVKVEGASTFDFTGDNLAGVSTLTLDGNATATLSMAQFNTLTPANIKADANVLTTAHLNIVGLDGTAFNVASVASGIVVDSVTVAAGTTTLNAATNLTGVQTIYVPEGSVLNLTAAQFQQLAGKGTIVGLDTNGNAGDGNKFTLNITDLTQADVNKDDSGTGGSAGFDLSNVQANATVNVTLKDATVTLGKFVSGTGYTIESIIAVGGVGNTANFTLAAGQTLGVTTYDQANGLHVAGGANSTVVYTFGSGAVPGLTQINAKNYSVTTLKALAAFFTANHSNVEYTIDELASAIELRLYQNAADMGIDLYATDRVVVIEAGITTPSQLVFNDWDATDEVRSLKLSLEGDVTLNGSLRIPTRTDKTGTMVQKFFDTLTIVSEGAKVNTIAGSVTTVPLLGGAITSQNNLLKITIDAKQDLVINGDIAFQSAGTDGTHDTASLTLTGTKNVTMTHLSTVDGTNDGISTLNVVNNLTGGGTLTVTGNTPAITSDSHLETINLSGTGNIVFDTKGGASEGITSATLSVLNASNLSGNLSLGDITDVDSEDFTFTSGSGVTKLTFGGLTFGGDTLDAAATHAAKWKFDLSKAAAGSEFHLGANTYGNVGDLVSATESNALVIDLGANATLYIDANTDFTQLDSLSITGVKNIVLKDGVTLTLTAAQASGLHIVAGADLDSNALTNGTVNVVDLSTAAVDLSGIAAEVAGVVTLKESNVVTHAANVTLNAATNLGNFTVQLFDVAGDNTTLGGQTIQFQNVAQAAHKITVVQDIADVDPTTSTNVVWLFTSVAAPVNTNGYAGNIGRVFFPEALVNGQNVENLFTTLPTQILRVDFHSLTDLAAALDSSVGVDRVIELASFTNAPLGINFADADRLEHIQSLDIRMGGQVTVGNIEIDNMVVPASPAVDPASIHFDSLIIRSVLADDTGDLLARWGFNETKHVSPTGLNTIGNISVGTSNGLDLKEVTMLTGLDLALNNKDHTSNVLTGADLSVGTITFDAEAPAAKTINTATLKLDGANDVTLKSLNVTDVDFAAATIDLTDIIATGVDGTTGFAGTLTITGASPAINLNAKAETLTIKGDATSFNTTATITLGSNDLLGKVVNAGVSGTELSNIVVNGYNGTLNLGTISNLDGTDDVAEGGNLTKYDAASGEEAFTFVTGAGVTTATLAAVAGQGTPTLTTGSHWVFDYTTAAPGSFLAFGAGLVLQTGSFLTLTNVPLVIESSIDLTLINLTMNSAAGIEVKTGQTLTLTPAQADALATAGVNIFGAGTVKLVGNASNLALGANLQTAIVDISGATLVVAPAVGFDTDATLSLTLGDANIGSIGGKAVLSGPTVIGSVNDDAITLTGTKDATVAGNGGNDTIDESSFGGIVTHNITSGIDTIVGLIGEVAPGTQQDVLVVSAGATVNALLTNDISAGVRGFVATAASANNGGTVNLTVDVGAAASKVDMSLATGSKGYSLTGSTDNATGTDTLIGSAFADLIAGGNTNQSNALAVDTMTGGLGADVFEFIVGTSTPLSMTTVTTTPGHDRELITVQEAATASGNLIVNYSVNGAAAVALNIALVNGDTVNQVSGKIAAAFSALTGFTATSINQFVSVEAANGSSITITGFNGAGADADTASDMIMYADGSDVAQVQTLTIGAAAGDMLVAGEKYTFTFTPAGAASSTAITLTALGGETAGDIAVRFQTEVNLQTAISATVAGNVLTITDTNPDNGGFTASAVTKGGFSGSGASVTGAADPATADIITDFLSGTDKIDLNLVAGSATNYAEAAGVADYATALAAANAAFGASPSVVQYFLTSVNGASGYGVLFFDANGDGTVDGVVKLVGITSANFTHTDIIA